MFQPSAITECLRGLVGFNQPDDPAYNNIETDLTASSSGITLRSAHPLCTIENIYNSAPVFQNFVYPNFAVSTEYPKGGRVIDDDKCYQSLSYIEESTIPPADDEENWKLIDPFSEWLRRVYDDAAINMMGAIIQYKNLHSGGKSLLDSQQLYVTPGRYIDRIVKEGRFVGFIITMLSAEGLQAIISKAGIQVDTAQNELNFYLYHSSRKTPLGIFPVSLTGFGDFEFKDLANAVMGYMNGTLDSGGEYYFGYYEDDLEGQAIFRNFDIERPPCQTCNTFDIRAFNAWSKYTRIKAFYVPSSGLQEGNELFDTSQIKCVHDTNWGINLSITVLCDITEFMCRNKMVFAKAFSMQLALEFLNKIAFNTRIGVIAEKTKALAMAELSEKEGSGSFKLEYIRQIQSMDIDFSSINSVCFPCRNKGRTINRRVI